MSLRPLAVAIAASLAVLGCTSLNAPTVVPTVKPLLTVRHGMGADQLYRVGRDLHEQGRDTEAINALKQALMVDPYHADAHNALGVIYSMQGQPTMAESEFRAAIKLAPQAAYVQENLALHLSRAAAPAPVASAAIEPASVITPLQAAPVPAGTPLPAPAPAPVVTLAPLAAAAPAQTSVVAAAPAPASAAVPPPATAAAPSPATVAAPPPAPVAAPSAVAAAASTPAPMLGPTHRVEVSNGNGTTGLARRVSELLPADEFDRARLTNTKPFGVVASVIQHVEGEAHAARDINALLPVQLPLAQVASLERQAKVRVLLGKDFPRDPALLTKEAALARVASR